MRVAILTISDRSARGERADASGPAIQTFVTGRLRAKGCLKCYLMVDADTPEVLGFYQRLGWDVMAVHSLGKDLDRS